MIAQALLDAFPDRDLAVETRGLSRRFGRQTALDGLDLSVPEGAFYLLVGPNGAGKTTTLRCLLDLLPPDSGSRQVCGLPVPEQGPAARSLIGYVADAPEFGYPKLPVARLLSFHARHFETWDAAYAERLIQALDAPTEQKFGKLSKGQARRVQLVMALAHRPALLLLDEPTDGLDPLARDRFLGLLAEHLAEHPTTVVVSTHLPYEVEGLADHLGVLQGGRLLAQLQRQRLEERLHTFRLQLPESWQPPAETETALLRREGRGREVAWTLWGDAESLRRTLAGSGATVRSLDRPTLDQACRILLGLESSGLQTTHPRGESS
ncbi:MAG: ABC transporter ATP-binding protein [Acidobacteriota bacterium]|nr:ABC transporter ATP-binding protein [Acidobacteriota bacterium]